jgi:tetratricopeptide (TPR) repeat protein
LADTLLAQDRLEEAEEQFRHILQRDPRHTLSLAGLGRVAYRRGNLQESIDYLQRSLSAGASKSTHLLLAEIYQRLGDRTTADNESRRAASLQNDAPRSDAFLEDLLRLRTGERIDVKRAQALLDRGHVSQAMALLERLVRDYPESVGSWLTLGRALNRQKDWAGAEKALSQALQLAPENPEVQVQMGITLYYQGSPRAVEHFRKAIQVQPECAPAYYNLGLWLARQEDSPGAIEAFRTAVRIQPNFSDAYLGLGSQLALQGYLPEAIRHFQQAVQLNSADPRARQLLRQALGQIAIPAMP